MPDRPVTCKVCVFWSRPESWASDQRGECQRIMPGHAPTGMPYVMTDRSHARLATPPDFSCSLWKASRG